MQDIERGMVLPLDKPFGWSSFDAIRYVQRTIRQRMGIVKVKIGHAGTLDPLATGCLLLCIGSATKQIAHLQNARKEYIVVMRLGAVTPSYDLETAPENQKSYDGITMEKLEHTISQFIGEQQQMPPIFSAKNIDGMRAYEHARSGGAVSLKANTIHIYSITILDFDLPYAAIKVVCGKGTYIRSLVHDIGMRLCCGAYVAHLRRTACGDYAEQTLCNIDSIL
jgi:tRNA pseudouridine55 synthase